MSKRAKKVLIVLASIVVLLVIVGLVVPHLIDMNWVRDLIAKQAQSALGRNVKLGEVQLRLIPSIRVSLTGLEVAESEEFGAEPFVKMDRLYVKVKLIPLLSKRVVIDRLVLMNPAISIIRSAQGKFNFDDILKRQAGPAEKSAPTEAAGEPKVTLGGIQVRGGTVRFLDKQTTPETAIQVNNLDARLRNLVPNAPIAFDVSANALGGSVTARGSVKPAPALDQMKADVDATFDDMNLAQLKPYVKQFQTEKLSGKFTASLDDTEGAARWRGTLSLQNYSAQIPNRPGASVSGTAFSVDGSLSAKYNFKEASFDGKVRLEGLNAAGLHPSLAKATVGSFEFEGAGSLATGSAIVKAKGKTTVSNLSATSSVQGKRWDISAPKLLFDIAADYDASDTTRAGEATVTLSIEKPVAKSSGGDSYSVSSVRVEKAHATMRQNDVSFELPSVALGTTAFKASGKVVLPQQSEAASQKAIAYDVAFDFENVSLNDLAATVPALASYRPSGNLSMNVAAKGATDKGPSVVKASATFKNVGLTHPAIAAPIQNLVGTADVSMFTEKEFAKLTGVAFSLGGAQVKVDANLTGVRVPVGSFKVTMDNLDVDQLLPKKGAETKPAPAPPAQPKPAGDSPLKRANVQGEIAIGKGRYKGVELANTGLVLIMKDGAITADKIRSELCGGKVNGSVKVASAFEQPAVVGNLAVDAVDIESLLTMSEGGKGMMKGKLSGSFNFDVPRFDPAQLMKLLKLNGKVSVPQGEFTGFDLARKLETISQLTGISQLGPENTVFRDLTAQFSFANEEATISSSRMALQNMDVTCAGTYRLDKTVNMRAEAILSEQLSAKNRGSDVQTYFENADRRIVVPFIATGTVPGIKVMLDMKRASERAIQRGTEKLKERILDEIGGKKKSEQQKPEEKALREIGGQLLDRVLKPR